MLDWKSLQNEYEAIGQQLTDAGLDQRKRIELQKKAARLSEVLSFHNKVDEVEKALQEAELQRDKEEGELKALYDEEITELKGRLIERTKELEDFLYPADECNNRSVFLEIRSGAGGQEAGLFAADLFRMYSAYALQRGWEVSIVDSHTTDLGGYREVVAYIKGRDVYKYLKFESGVHRVQRVPKTETAGRIHTSTVTVAILPEVDDVDVTINQNDLRIDTYRAGGAGGQHVNKTDSAIRITHIPTGLVVTCQDERSQTKNKSKAMKVLQARLFEQEKVRREAEERVNRKQQIGSGDRSEKIRTYNYPQNRITDHRIDVTLKKLDIIMEGVLDDLLLPLIDWELKERKAKGMLL